MFFILRQMGAVLAGVLIISSLARAEVVEKVIAIVNDQVITKTDVDDFQTRLKSGGLVDEALLKMSDPKELLADRKILINHLIDEKILDSEVKRKDLAVTIERVEKEIRTITSRNRITRAQLKQALEEKGVDFSHYQDFIKTSLERQTLIEREVSSKIKISDEDVAAHYSKQKGGAEIYQYKLSHILFLSKNGGEKAAKKRAEEVLQKVGKSQSFEALAKQYSEDPNFAEGGALGNFRAGELSPEMEQAVRNLSPGDTTSIVPSRMGYHIIKLIGKTTVANPELEKEKERLRENLFAQAFKTQFRNWLNQKRQEAFIRIN